MLQQPAKHKSCKSCIYSKKIEDNNINKDDSSFA